MYTRPWRSVAGGCRKRAASIGVSVSETKPEIRIATPIVTANSCSSRPTMPPMKRTGMNTATSDSVIETIVNPISFEPRERRRHRVLALLHVPHDVLEHDDRVVDDEADRERQRHQRQVVEAVAEQVHRGERADDRRGQRQARDDRRREVPQEQEDHEHDEHDREQQRELDVVHRLADRLRAVACGRRGRARRAAASGSAAAARGWQSTISTVFVPGCRLTAR